MKFGLDGGAIKKIKDAIRKFPQVEKVIIYGSRAKGTQRPSSDINLTLQGKALDLRVLNQIRVALDELNVPYTFDLSLYDQIENPDLVEHIKRVGVEF